MMISMLQFFSLMQEFAWTAMPPRFSRRLCPPVVGMLLLLVIHDGASSQEDGGEFASLMLKVGKCHRRYPIHSGAQRLTKQGVLGGGR